MKDNSNHIPKHVGIIMDGNRRWAREHGFEIIFGHKKAAEDVIEPIIDKAGEMGIKYLTFWCFSTENWRRDKMEIKGLMEVFRYVLDKKLVKFKEKGAKIKVLGDLSKFPQDIKERVEEAISDTENNNKITVNFALNYGGRQEIVRAVNKWIKVQSLKCKVQSQVQSLEITEEQFSNYLDAPEVPDPDLIIRTGGETRLSGFMPWQSAYSELYFTEVYFPDFTPEEFEKAVGVYQGRQRRFGK